MITKDDIFKKNISLLWPVLCFQAGVINTGGFLACHRFVSHVTGFGTRAGVELSDKNFLFFIEMMAMPLFFMLGSFISSYFVYKSEVRNCLNSITRPLWMMLIILGSIILLGESGFFGPFGEPLIHQRDYLLLALLCIVCGLQNGFYATLSQGMIRTTHMTGISTDMAMHLAQIVVKKDKNAYLWLGLRSSKFLSFTLGAVLSAFVYQEFQYSGFLFPLLILGISIPWTYYGIIRQNEILQNA